MTSVFRLAVFAICLLAASSPARAELGEDGLHKNDWFAITFRDIREDLAAAKQEGKRLVMIFEQRGCTYCRKMHETVLSDPEVVEYLKANFKIVQYNLFGDEEVTDLDGEVLTEKTAARRWGIIYTPTVLFMPEDASDDAVAGKIAVANMPGAFGKWTFVHMFEWVKAKGYEGEEHFQKYHARRLDEMRAAGKLKN